MDNFLEAFSNELTKLAKASTLAMAPWHVRQQRKPPTKEPFRPVPAKQNLGTIEGLQNAPKRPKPTPPKLPASTKPISQLTSMKTYGPKSGYFGGSKPKAPKVPAKPVMLAKR